MSSHVSENRLDQLNQTLEMGQVQISTHQVAHEGTLSFEKPKQDGCPLQPVKKPLSAFVYFFKEVSIFVQYRVHLTFCHNKQ